MKLAIFGTAGKVGSRVAAEAGSRGHHVIPVVRDPARLGRDLQQIAWLTSATRVDIPLRPQWNGGDKSCPTAYRLC
jgi:nucleoside-diphosphate-sugar epimerase